MHGDNVPPYRREYADLLGADQGALAEHQASARDILPRPPDIQTLLDLAEDADLGQGLAATLAILLVRIFELDDGVSAPGYRGAGHDPDRGAGPDFVLRHVARRHLADHAKEVGRGPRGAHGALGLNRVAVHGRVVQARDVDRRAHVLRQDLAQRAQYLFVLSLEDIDVAEDLLQGFLN